MSKGIKLNVSGKTVSQIDRLINHYGIQTETNSLSDKARTIIQNLYDAYLEEQREIKRLERHIRNH